LFVVVVVVPPNRQGVKGKRWVGERKGKAPLGDNSLFLPVLFAGREYSAGV